ncbi:MAG: hypothetical protein NTY22_09165 [Proteobacteria bacterium]|nr:hypothetical protein [Pseudomonadota bacterium]
MKKLLILLVVLSGFVSAEGTTRELGILKEGDSFTLSGKTEKFLFIPYYKLSEASFFVLPINIKPEHITPDILDNKKFSGEERWKLFSFISCQKYHYFSISLVHHLGWGIPAIG